MPRLSSLDLTFIEPAAHARRGFPLTGGLLAEGVLPVGSPVYGRYVGPTTMTWVRRD